MSATTATWARLRGGGGSAAARVHARQQPFLAQRQHGRLQAEHRGRPRGPPFDARDDDGSQWRRLRHSRQRVRRALRSEEHTSELQSRENLVCRLLLEKKKKDILSLLYSKKKKKKNTNE